MAEAFWPNLAKTILGICLLGQSRYGEINSFFGILAPAPPKIIISGLKTLIKLAKPIAFIFSCSRGLFFVFWYNFSQSCPLSIIIWPTSPANSVKNTRHAHTDFSQAPLPHYGFEIVFIGSANNLLLLNNFLPIPNNHIYFRPANIHSQNIFVFSDYCHCPNCSTKQKTYRGQTFVSFLINFFYFVGSTTLPKNRMLFVSLSWIINIKGWSALKSVCGLTDAVSIVTAVAAAASVPFSSTLM